MFILLLEYILQQAMQQNRVWILSCDTHSQVSRTNCIFIYAKQKCLHMGNLWLNCYVVILLFVLVPACCPHCLIPGAIHNKFT